MSGNNTVVSDWDNEYARLARVASQLRSGVTSSGGNNNNQESSARALQTGLSRLESSLNHLPLASGEIQRRKRLVQHLQQTTTAASATTTTTNTPTAGGNAAAAAAAAPGQQQSQMQIAMQQQDAMIDELAVGVGRLKNQTSAIHEEANMHNNLLNEMDTNLDTAQQGLLDETNRAQRLREDQSVWKLQLIVAGLSVLLVLLVLMGLS